MSGAVVAVLLAAGGGTRYTGETHKLLAPLDGRPVYSHALHAALTAAIGPVLVVTGAVTFDLPVEVTEIANPEWATGQASSLRAALAALDASVEHAVVGLADQPFVPSSAWRAVASAPPAPIVVATYAGRRGPNPVRLHRIVWPLVASGGDEGARTLIRDRPEWVREVPCEGSAADIDTLEDLRRWTSS